MRFGLLASRHWRTICGTLLGLAMGVGTPAEAGPNPHHYSIHLKDPDHLLGDKQNLLIDDLKSALDEWGRWIRYKGTLDVEVRVAKTAQGRMDGASVTNRPLGEKFEGRTVLEESATYKLRTGRSVDPARPDLVIQVDPQYLEQVWLDPKPQQRNLPVPTDKVDFVSVCLHELSHAYGINGFRERQSGDLPAEYAGNLDRFVVKRGDKFYFTGANAEKIFGGPIPITSTNTSQNMTHLGNLSDIDARTVDDLMNGVRFKRGYRYFISPLDRAILRDLGVPIVI